MDLQRMVEHALLHEYWDVAVALVVSADRKFDSQSAECMVSAALRWNRVDVAIAMVGAMRQRKYPYPLEEYLQDVPAETVKFEKGGAARMFARADGLVRECARDAQRELVARVHVPITFQEELNTHTRHLRQMWGELGGAILPGEVGDYDRAGERMERAFQYIDVNVRAERMHEAVMSVWVSRLRVPH